MLGWADGPVVRLSEERSWTTRQGDIPRLLLKSVHTGSPSCSLVGHSVLVLYAIRDDEEHQFVRLNPTIL